jgi:nucleoside-diphosphate-sugar epimerase
MMSKVLVTGAGGFLGKFIVLGLLRREVGDVICQVRGTADEKFLQKCRDEFPKSTISVVRANLLDQASMDAALKDVDVVIHAAAGTKGATADMVLNSVTGTQNLIRAAVSNRIQRIVLVSSFSVYNTSGLSNNAVFDEAVPLESTGVPRGGYAYSKVRQEQVVQELLAGSGIALITVRPGVIYGPGGGEFSGRVGLSAFGRFLSIGGGCELPLNYVENCGDACAEVATNANAQGVYNLVDSDLPTCREYLSQYRLNVKPLKVIPVPYFALFLGSKILERYHLYSKGQLPAVFTTYVVKSMYRPFRHHATRLLQLGWKQPVSTKEGMRRAFADFKQRK